MAADLPFPGPAGQHQGVPLELFLSLTLGLELELESSSTEGAPQPEHWWLSPPPPTAAVQLRRPPQGTAWGLGLVCHGQRGQTGPPCPVIPASSRSGSGEGGGSQPGRWCKGASVVPPWCPREHSALELAGTRGSPRKLPSPSGQKPAAAAALLQALWEGLSPGFRPHLTRPPCASFWPQIS